jgi:hypothetical protein
MCFVGIKTNQTITLFKIEYSGARGLGHHFRVMLKEANAPQVKRTYFCDCGNRDAPLMTECQKDGTNLTIHRRRRLPVLVA